MSSEGMRPRSGARYELTRVEDEPEPAASADADGSGERAGTVIYRGFVHLPDAAIPVEVKLLLPAGDARAELGEGSEGGAARKEIERLAAAFVRSATKSAAASGGSLPRKIVRWRG
ncbi:MAG TPA: hypothetical protein VE093_45790 [Polyangiaceae bacterium]|nr:hypothetical protein [Polyangiaceae bacterium]